MTAPTASQTQQQVDAPARRSGAKLRFEVVAGAHRGAVLLLERTDYRIGSSPDADIVLSDPGIAPEHAALHVTRGMVRIGATGADVRVGQEPVPLSRGCRVRLPVDVVLGEAQIRLSDPGGDDLGQYRWRQSRLAAGIAACCLLALIAMAMTAARTGLFAPRLASEGGIQDRSVAPRPAGPPAPGRPPGASAATVGDAAGTLKRRLEDAKISTLQVGAEDGRLAVTGTLPPQDGPVWAGIQQWFDETYGGRIVLTTRINAPGARTFPGLPVQAVWYGDNPYVLLADGEHIHKGAVLDNGWIVRDITPVRIVFVRDGETAALTYGVSQDGAPGDSPPQAGDPQDRQAGDRQAGDPQAGDPQAGDRQAGDRQAGDRQAGDPRAGGAQPGDSAPPGGSQSGESRSGDSRAGDPQSQGGDPQP